ncbi:MAG: rhodanese-like domain-containing protein [Caldilineaceae bacterium]
MDGGRAKWVADGRAMTRDVPSYPATTYTAARATTAPSARSATRCWPACAASCWSTCAARRVQGRTAAHARLSPGRALRGGHIPAPRTCRGRAANEDGTFKSADQLRAIYEQEQGLASGDDVVAYCRIGERSSHTLVCAHLSLGYDTVRNYDGSWTEWGMLGRDAGGEIAGMKIEDWVDRSCGCHFQQARTTQSSVFIPQSFPRRRHDRAWRGDTSG